MTVVNEWTGRYACNLQAALRMSNEAFANHLGVAPRTVATWHDRPETMPRPSVQEILDTALDNASPGAQERFWLLASSEGGPKATSTQINTHIMSGSAQDVLQARNVSGGVHFHTFAKPPGPKPQQLPGEVRMFINRIATIGQLDAILDQHWHDPHAPALVLMTGTAGVGKTSLAVYWAHRARDQFPDGSLYVNLHGYDSDAPIGPPEVLGRFLRALGVAATEIPLELEDRAELYRTLTAGRRMIVALDNAAGVNQVRPLLPGANGPFVIVTSRNRLSGLAVRDGALRVPIDLLAEDDAISLVNATIKGYRPTDDIDEIAQLARMCARLPLALRIAAERAAVRPMMPLGELINDLRSESSLWDALSLEDEDEANAVRSVFAWSYRSLPAKAARLFKLLGVHPGLDVSVASAAALCGQTPREVSALLDVLAGAHLLERTSPDRYQFHDLLRAYAADQAHQGEQVEIREALSRLVSWYLHTTANAVSAIQTFFPLPLLGPAEAAATPLRFTTSDEANIWYQSESTNLRAVANAATAHGFDQIAWQLPAVLHGIHVSRNPFDDWLALANAGLDAARRLNDQQAEALMLATLGVACSQSGQLDKATSYLNEASPKHHETGDYFGEIDCINALGWVHLRARRLAKAVRQFEQVGTLANDFDEQNWKYVSPMNLATAQFEAGNLEAAADYARRSIEMMREANADQRLEFDSWLVLAQTHRELGQYQKAVDYLTTATEIANSTSPWYQAQALLEKSRLDHSMRHFEDAMAACQEAAGLYRSIPERFGEARVLDTVGRIYKDTGRAGQAAEFHTLAVTMLSDLRRRFDQAIALDHLAEAKRDIENYTECQAHWNDAQRLLVEFDDARALALKSKIDASLAEIVNTL